MAATSPESVDTRRALPALAAELVRVQPQVIFTHTRTAALAAARATTTIPIVVGPAGEEVLLELAGNLARPTGNVTGITLTNTQWDQKCLQLLSAPRAGRSRPAPHGGSSKVAKPHLLERTSPRGRARWRWCSTPTTRAHTSAWRAWRKDWGRCGCRWRVSMQAARAMCRQPLPRQPPLGLTVPQSLLLRADEVIE